MTKSHSFPPFEATKGGLVSLTRAFPPFGGIIGGLLLLFVACHKETPDPPPPPPPVAEKPDTLPPMTTTGANTFGCYLNGKLWLPKADWKAYFDPSFNTIQAAINENGGGYMTFRTSIEGIKETFSFGLYAKKGRYYARSGVDSNNISDFGIWYHNFKDSKWYYPDDRGFKKSNYLDVNFVDTSSNIISGEFQFVLHKGSNYKISKYSDSLAITKGRFDIRYRD